MKISTYSRNNILEGLSFWNVPKDYADPMIDYLIYGFEPGSFFTAVLANDFMGAVQHSHPANTIPALKQLCEWINNKMPKKCRGSYDKVNKWLEMSEKDRRAVLVKERLVFTEKEETWMALQGKPTHEPMLF